MSITTGFLPLSLMVNVWRSFIECLRSAGGNPIPLLRLHYNLTLGSRQPLENKFLDFFGGGLHWCNLNVRLLPTRRVAVAWSV